MVAGLLVAGGATGGATGDATGVVARGPGALGSEPVTTAVHRKPLIWGTMKLVRAMPVRPRAEHLPMQLMDP